MTTPKSTLTRSHPELFHITRDLMHLSPSCNPTPKYYALYLEPRTGLIVYKRTIDTCQIACEPNGGEEDERESAKPGPHTPTEGATLRWDLLEQASHISSVTGTNAGSNADDHERTTPMRALTTSHAELFHARDFLGL